MTASEIAKMMRSGSSTSAVRQAAKSSGCCDVFEAYRRGEISSSEGAEILQLQRESNYLLVRLWDTYIGAYF